MKAKIVALSVLFLFFASPVWLWPSGFDAKAEIPGGIAYHDGKDIVYYNFTTKEIINLTEDIDKFETDQFSVSEDAQYLTWAQDSKLWSTKLLRGKIRSLKKQIFEYETKNRTTTQIVVGEEDVAIPEIRNLSLSPKANHFYYESEEIKGSNNTAVSSITYRFILDSDAQAGRTNFSLEKNAYFGSWAKTSPFKEDAFEVEETLAFIYKTPNGWGPIKIVNSKYIGGFSIYTEKGKKDNFYKKPGFYKIPVFIEKCEGLAWKPNGLLTYMSDGKIFSIDVSKIKSMAQGSKRPADNVFPIPPQLIVKAINGNRYCWVSNDAFVFRSADNALCLWNQGELNVLLETVPEIFFYCNWGPLYNVSDFNPDSYNLIASNTSDDTNVPPSVSGGDNIWKLGNGNAENGGDFRRFYVGSIQTSLHGGNYSPRHYTGPKYSSLDMSFNGSVDVECRDLRDQEGKSLEYVLPYERHLDDIKDPRQYGYNRSLTPPKIKGMWSTPTETIDLNQVIILKLRNKNGTSDYAAIKPIEVEPQYKSSDDWPEDKWLQSSNYKKWDWSKGPIPVLERVVYEWKFWPSVPDDEDYYLEVKEWQTAEMPILKEFEIGGIKFRWQLIFETELELRSQTPFQYVNNNYNKDVQNPSRYYFSEVHPGSLGLIRHKDIDTPTWILKIDAKYILIRPLKNNKNIVTYEWKYWPEILPVKKIPKTALNQ